MAIKLANQKRRPKLAEMLVQLARQKDEQESEEETDDEINDVVENGFSQSSSQNISQQFNRFIFYDFSVFILIFRQARIDTDTSSRHSENLFDPQPPADLVATVSFLVRNRENPPSEKSV